jgi:hypothetical protein
MAAPSAASRPHAPRNQRKSETTQTSSDTNSAEPSEAAAGEGNDPVTKKALVESSIEAPRPRLPLHFASGVEVSSTRRQA